MAITLPPTFGLDPENFIRVTGVNGNEPIGQIQVTNQWVIGNNVLSILVARPTQLVFPEIAADPSFFNHPAGSTFAGLTTDQASIPGSQNYVRLAGVVSGNITGDVTVGEIFTLRSLGGTISGAIRADKFEGGVEERTDDAIKHVFAGQGITGTIVAGSGTPNVNTGGTIGQIVVGGLNQNALGIEGDILAESGLIDSIESTGPIGVTRRVQIRGGYGVQFLTCRAVNGQGAVLARNVNADVKADVQVPFPEGTTNNGRINRWRISGNLTGDILEANAVRSPFRSDTCGIAQCDYVYQGTDWGIFVDGAIDVPINIKRVMGANIEAATFVEPIIVGYHLKGRIEAIAGSIPWLEVGFAPEAAGFVVPPGFVGSACAPPWETAVCDIPPHIPEPRLPEPQSLIKAASEIGTVRIRNMSLEFGFLSKLYSPRLESPHIGRLEVGDTDPLTFTGLRAGIIWSGVGDPTVRPIPDAAYSQIDDTIIQRIETTAGSPIGPQPRDVYVKHPKRFDVAGYMGGTIFAPWLAPFEQIRIGCAIVEEGRVEIRENDGLMGHVVVNANEGLGQCSLFGATGDWIGKVAVGELSGGGPREFFEGQGGTREAPYYTESANLHGGGAIGLVPFNLHEEDCVPTSYDPLASPASDASPNVILQSEFSRPIWTDKTRTTANTSTQRQGILLRFYGPVRTPDTYGFPLDVDFRPSELVPWTAVDMGPKLQCVLSRAGTDENTFFLSHHVRVVGWEVPDDRYMLPAGWYRFRPRDVAPELRCAGLGYRRTNNVYYEGFYQYDTINTAPLVGDFEFVFQVLSDGDVNGVADTLGPVDPGQAGGCPADLTNSEAAFPDPGIPDAAIDINDLLYFLAAFEAGHEYADLDGSEFAGNGEPDGAVTIDDLLFFMYRFGGGC